MSAIRSALRALVADDQGATAIEYGLISAFLGTGLIASLSALGGGTGGMWTTLQDILATHLLN